MRGGVDDVPYAVYAHQKVLAYVQDTLHAQNPRSVPMQQHTQPYPKGTPLNRAAKAYRKALKVLWVRVLRGRCGCEF